jgi:tRNA G18 (ribose-2'-O)-methylase SpoU
MRLVSLDDPNDARLSDYRDVRDARWLSERKIFLAEGRMVVRALLESPRFELRSLLVTEPALAGLADLLREDSLIYLVERPVMDRVSGVRFHQGCVAVAESGPEPALGSCLARRTSERHIVVVLESVSDPDNVGSTFRNAFCFGVDAVLLSPGCAPPLYRKAVRTSMGAILRIPFATLADWPRDLGQLREEGFTLLGLTPDPDAVDLDAFADAHPLPEKMALVVGSEGHGLSPEARGWLDRKLRIGMVPEADSLNAATAAAIAMQRLWREGGADA